MCLISKLPSWFCPEPALIYEAMGASEHLLCPGITSAVLPPEGLCEVCTSMILYCEPKPSAQAQRTLQQ